MQYDVDPGGNHAMEKHPIKGRGECRNTLYIMITLSHFTEVTKRLELRLYGHYFWTWTYMNLHFMEVFNFQLVNNLACQKILLTDLIITVTSFYFFSGF